MQQCRHSPDVGGSTSPAISGSGGATGVGSGVGVGAPPGPGVGVGVGLGPRDAAVDRVLVLANSGVRSIPLYAPVLFDLGTESIPAVKLGDSNGVSIPCIFDDSDFITLYSDACSYR